MSDRFKFKFLICRDGENSISREYSIEDLIELLDDDEILVNHQDCDCELNESVNVCEGGCVIDYEKEKIVGKIQSTGLKDKNGKLIFEGDIVSLREINYEIMWQVDGYFGNGPYKDRVGYCMDLEAHHECEIIGNIHENPELLEVKS